MVHKTLGAYYQCYKQPFALNHVLKSFRAVYPDAPITLVCDNGLNFSMIAKSYNCNYIHLQERIAQNNGLIFNHRDQVIEFIRRFITYVQQMDTDWVLLLEDDVVVYQEIDLDNLQYTLNGINPNEFLPKEISAYLKKSKQCYGGCGGSILSVPFIKQLNIEEVLQECNRMWDLVNKGASDIFLTAMILRFGGTIGQYEGFAEAWYPNLAELQKRNQVRVLHQYKDLYIPTTFNKVIIWGYPLYSHTHSYIHSGWYNAFTYLGYETLWLADVQTDMVFENCLFISEGYADSNIPLHPSNTYIIHVLVHPEKYATIKCKYVDMRYNVNYINDYNYQYNLLDKIQQKKVTKISAVTWFEKEASVAELHPAHRKYNYPYPAVYTAWATDLLPHEFNFEIEPSTSKKVYFIGSVSSGNQLEIEKFINACKKHTIEVIISNPWENPLSFLDNRKLIQDSIICPDIRGSGDVNRISKGENGTCHKQNGYIPCRVFKNISYGKLGASNSKKVLELFGEDLIVYDDNEEQLVEKCLARKDDHEFIKRQMHFVQDNHTYLNRVQDLFTVISLISK